MQRWETKMISCLLTDLYHIQFSKRRSEMFPQHLVELGWGTWSVNDMKSFKTDVKRTKLIEKTQCHPTALEESFYYVAIISYLLEKTYREVFKYWLLLFWAPLNFLLFNKHFLESFRTLSAPTTQMNWTCPSIPDWPGQEISEEPRKAMDPGIVIQVWCMHVAVTFVAVLLDWLRDLCTWWSSR